MAALSNTVADNYAKSARIMLFVYFLGYYRGSFIDLVTPNSIRRYVLLDAVWYMLSRRWSNWRITSIRCNTSWKTSLKLFVTLIINQNSLKMSKKRTLERFYLFISGIYFHIIKFSVTLSSGFGFAFDSNVFTLFRVHWFYIKSASDYLLLRLEKSILRCIT